MYATFSDDSRLASDLAANLTDPALEILAHGSSRRDSVALELQLWHTLEAEFERELGRRPNVFSHGDNISLDRGLRRLVHRAVRQVAAEEHALPLHRGPSRESLASAMAS